MGGKNKQRTKNNVRPSSSGRSADQLTSLSVDGFTGMVPGLFPTLVTPTIDTHLTTELQLCFKKFNKKDPITKAKALQELTELVPQSKVDDIVAALPTWTHFYKILSVDSDRKVRELTQCCHGAIVTTCGRRIAPYLKQLMPWWLQAQYDEHPPAMLHAVKSLQNTFPDNKLPEVLAFCKEEVASHIIDILTKNGDIAHVKKRESAEDAEASRSRAASGALSALRFCLQHGHADCARAPLQHLLDADAFWAYSGSADPTLRASWYLCVCGALQHYAGAWRSAHVARVLRAAAAPDAAPRAAAARMAALLALMQHIPNWHEHLEKKELFWKRIFEMLESGGWGDARQLSSMLLPLLTSLPEELLTDDFYEAFFDAMLTGLEKKSSSNVRNEVWAWSRGVELCVRHVAERRAGAAPLVARLVRRWALLALAAPRALPPAAAALAALARGPHAALARGPHAARAVWPALQAALLPAPDADPAALPRALAPRVQLLLALRDLPPPPDKAVRFEDSPAPRSEPAPPPQPEPEAAAGRAEYLHRLTEAAAALVGRALELAREARAAGAVAPLLPLLERGAAPELWARVADALGAATPLELYTSVLRPWLAADDMRSRALLRLVFLLVRDLPEDERDAVLKTFDSMSPVVVEWALEACTAGGAAGAEGAVARWARGEAAGAAARGLVRKALAGNTAATELLLRCLEADSEDDAVLSPSAAEEVLTALERAVAAPGGAALGAAAARAAPPRPALLLALLERALAAAMQTAEEEGAEGEGEGAEGLRAVWRAALRRMPPGAARELCARAARLVHRRLHLGFDNSESELSTSDACPDLNINAIEQVVSLCPSFLDFTELDVRRAVELCAMMLSPPGAQAHPGAPAPPMPPVALAVEGHALTYDVVEERLSCPVADNDVIDAVINHTLPDLNKSYLVTYMTNVLFKAMYLEITLLHEDVDRELCDDILRDKYIETQLCKILHEYMVVRALHKGYDYWQHYDIIEQSKLQLDSSIDRLIDNMSPQTRTVFLKRLTEEALTHGYYWSYARKYFRDKINSIKEGATEVTRQSEAKEEKDDFICAGVDLETLTDSVTGSGYFHTLQAAGLAHSAAAACGRALVAAHGAAPGLRAAVAAAAPHTPPCSPPDILLLVDLMHLHPEIMLYHKELGACSWLEASCAAAAARALRHGVGAAWLAPPPALDAAALAAAQLLRALRRDAARLAETKVAALAVAALRLAGGVERLARDVAAGRAPAAGAPPHLARLPREWNDVFLPDVADNVYSIVVHVLESCVEQSTASVSHVCMVRALRECLTTARLPFPAEGASGAAGSGAVSLRRAVEAAAATLGAARPTPYAYLAHALLENLLEPCILADAAALAQWSECSGAEEEERAPPPLSAAQLLAPLRAALDAADAATRHVRAGEDTCAPARGGALEAAAVGAALLADLLYRLGRLARGDLPHHYLRLCREGEHLERLLTVSLRLLPAEVLAGRGDGGASAWFTGVCGEGAGAGAAGRLACRALYAGVAGAGAAAAAGLRAAAPPRAAAALTRLVERHVTPHLVREHFAALHPTPPDIEDAEIRVNASTYEAWCKLTVDDKDIELYIRLARSHPLAPPTLAAPDSPVSNTHWLLLYLTYQNGSVAGAMRLWASSVASKVERATQCYICYCRLHPASGRLPTVVCYTCRNRFHNVCLRKWFSSSGKSHCPLCRTKF